MSKKASLRPQKGVRAFSLSIASQEAFDSGGWEKKAEIGLTM